MMYFKYFDGGLTFRGFRALRPFRPTWLLLRHWRNAHAAEADFQTSRRPGTSKLANRFPYDVPTRQQRQHKVVR